jgi:hypothetical protein
MGAAPPTACSPDLTPEASPHSVCSLLLAGCLVGAQEDAATIPYGGSGAGRGDGGGPYPTWRRPPKARPSKPSKPSKPGKPGPPHPVPDPSQPAPSCPGCAAVLCPALYAPVCCSGVQFSNSCHAGCCEAKNCNPGACS